MRWWHVVCLYFKRFNRIVSFFFSYKDSNFWQIIISVKKRNPTKSTDLNWWIFCPIAWKWLKWSSLIIQVSIESWWNEEFWQSIRKMKSFFFYLQLTFGSLHGSLDSFVALYFTKHGKRPFESQEYVIRLHVQLWSSLIKFFEILFERCSIFSHGLCRWCWWQPWYLRIIHLHSGARHILLSNTVSMMHWAASHGRSLCVTSFSLVPTIMVVQSIGFWAIRFGNRSHGFAMQFTLCISQ